MGAEKDIIIAVELASTAIRAIAGKREPDGSMQVLAFAQEESSNTIRKGIIDNIDKTTLALSRVVAKLSDKLGSRINSIYVGLGGQSLRSVHNRVLLQFDGVELLSHKTIDKMHDTNSGVVYSNAEIKEVIPQEFTIGSRSVVDPVGMQAEMLEANFINIIARSTLEENIRRCVNGAGLEVQDVFISPLCVANTLLTANEKRSGCTLVDMGADTTTVSVYSNNILRHLCVIPLGGSNVTSDITNLKVEAEEAEELKKKYGTAFRPDKEDKTEKKITLSFDRTEKEEKLQEIVEARYEEIIANVCQRISPFKEKMLSGTNSRSYRGFWPCERFECTHSKGYAGEYHCFPWCADRRTRPSLYALLFVACRKGELCRRTGQGAYSRYVRLWQGGRGGSRGARNSGTSA